MAGDETTNSMWASFASRELHWHCSNNAIDSAWLAQSDDGCWVGWSATSGEQVVYSSANSWQPWTAVVDASAAPLMRWFSDGRTNAAFNEVDRHVLSGHGAATAFITEPDGDEAVRVTTICELFIEVSLVAHALRERLGASSHRRVALFLPNTAVAAVWGGAAKVLGVPYIAVASGASVPSLSSRLADTASAFLVTVEDLLPAATAAAAALTLPPAIVLEGGAVPDDAVPMGERAKAGAAPTVVIHEAAALVAWSRVELLRLSDAVPPRELDEAAATRPTLVRNAWQLASPTPVEASHPLFVLYTSGSTGKPKGIVHTHGGFEVGLIKTSRVVFDLQGSGRRDTLLAVGTPGWIMGQSYMWSAALLCRCPSVLLDGSANSPPDRVPAIVARDRVTVLKAGTTLLRMIMATPNSIAMLRKHDLASLRLGNCARPRRDSNAAPADPGAPRRIALLQQMAHRFTTRSN